MFKSTGYFNCFRCPFFVSGLCERPYCHFRHEKPPDDGGAGKGLVRPSSPLNNVEATAQAILRLEAADSTTYSKPSSAAKPQYKPTPKAKTSSGASSTGVPEYTPTPKKQLQKLKRKSGDLEYDPVSNFSCSGGTGNKGGGGRVEEVAYVPTSKKANVSSEKTIQIPKFCSEVAVGAEDEDTPEDDAHFSDIEEEEKGGAVGKVSEGKEDEGSEPDSSTAGDSHSEAASADSTGVPNGATQIVSGVYPPVTADSGTDHAKSLADSSQSKDLTSHSSKHTTKHVSKSSSEKLSKSGKSHSSSSSSHSQKHSSSSSNKHHSSSSKSSSSHSSEKKSSSPSKQSRPKSSSSHNSSSKSSHHSSSKSSHHSSSKSSHHSDSKSSSSSGKQSSSHHTSSSSTSQKPTSSKHSHSGGSNSAKSSHTHSDKTVKHHSSSKGRSEGEPDAKRAKSSHSSDKSKTSSGHVSSHSSSSNHKHSSGSKRSHSTDSNAPVSKKSKLDSEAVGSKHGDKNGISVSGRPVKDEKSSDKAALLRRKSSEVNQELFGNDSDPDDSPEPSGEREMTEEEMQRFLEESDYAENDDVYGECLHFFKTCPGVPPKGAATAKKEVENKQPNGSETEPAKKRVAHRTSDQILRRPMPKKKVVIHPAQAMRERYATAMKSAAAAAAASKHLPLPSTSSGGSVAVTAGAPGMVRIAHVPQPSTSRTVATTANKSQKRIAHVPSVKNLKRPVIPSICGGKVPTNIRQQYLNHLIDECLKVCKSEEEAFQRGEEEEKDIYNRCSNKKIYLNLAASTIRKLRQEREMGGATSPTLGNGFQFSHEAILGGSHALKTSFTVKRSGTKVLPDVFRGAELYKRLTKYLMTEEQLRENCFPRPSEDGKRGEAKYYTNISRNLPASAAATVLVGSKDEKICLRCGKRFVILSDGSYAKEEECFYHWGKAWRRKVNGQFENLYSCCSGDLNSPPCGVARLHVHETNKLENFKGYMTPLKASDPPRDGNYGVYALDCEMVYTMAGIELARVTVINDKCQAVYESIVKPKTEVIDYNTRFSGLTAKDLVGVETTLQDVQAALLEKFSDKTILIGHSLESDLMALKLIHSHVVDTSIVFPHRAGPPIKRALRNLVSDYLQKIIQNDVGGHDSKEDAEACMQLMQWKIKEDAKLEFGIK